MAEVAHRHQWKLRSNIDGCHFIEARHYCPECGAQSADFNERDFGADPMQIAFADEHCPRCRELLRGQEPWSWQMTV